MSTHHIDEVKTTIVENLKHFFGAESEVLLSQVEWLLLDFVRYGLIDGFSHLRSPSRNRFIFTVRYSIPISSSVMDILLSLPVPIPYRRYGPGMQKRPELES